MHLSLKLVMVLWDVTSHTRIWYVPCDNQLWATPKHEVQQQLTVARNWN